VVTLVQGLRFGTCDADDADKNTAIWSLGFRIEGIWPKTWFAHAETTPGQKGGCRALIFRTLKAAADL
jgi:hypothetical protein